MLITSDRIARYASCRLLTSANHGKQIDTHGPLPLGGGEFLQAIDH